MRRSTKLGLLFGLCLALSLTLQAAAGPLFPCVRAASSKNGNFLVLIEAQDKPGTQNIQQWSYEVFPKENFINAKDRLDSPGAYWHNWMRWSVLLDVDPVHHDFSCPLSLITDDGEFLVLLHVGPMFPADSVLQIYRKRDHLGDPVRQGPDHGVFIKSITLNDIWPPDKITPNTWHWSDETPQWFAEGTFEFTLDCRQLIHKTRWGNTVRINLSDGSISRE